MSKEKEELLMKATATFMLIFVIYSVLFLLLFMKSFPRSLEQLIID